MDLALTSQPGLPLSSYRFLMSREKKSFMCFWNLVLNEVVNLCPKWTVSGVHMVENTPHGGEYHRWLLSLVLRALYIKNINKGMPFLVIKMFYNQLKGALICTYRKWEKAKLKLLFLIRAPQFSHGKHAPLSSSGLCHINIHKIANYFVLMECVYVPWRSWSY